MADDQWPTETKADEDACNLSSVSQSLIPHAHEFHFVLPNGSNTKWLINFPEIELHRISVRDRIQCSALCVCCLRFAVVRRSCCSYQRRIVMAQAHNIKSCFLTIANELFGCKNWWTPATEAYDARRIVADLLAACGSAIAASSFIKPTFCVPSTQTERHTHAMTAVDISHDDGFIFCCCCCCC